MLKLRADEKCLFVQNASNHLRLGVAELSGYPATLVALQSNFVNTYDTRTRLKKNPPIRYSSIQAQ
jgi:hypothetical protein